MVLFSHSKYELSFTLAVSKHIFFYLGSVKKTGSS